MLREVTEAVLSVVKKRLRVHGNVYGVSTGCWLDC